MVETPEVDPSRPALVEEGGPERSGMGPSLGFMVGGLVGLLPWSWAIAIGGSARFAAWMLPRRKRDRAIYNLELAGVRPPSVSRTARVLGGSLLEMLWCTARSPEEIFDKFEIEGLDELKRAHAEGKGVLVAHAHLGNWELCGAAMGLVAPVETVARRLRANGFEERIVAMRARLRVRTLMRNERGSSIAVARALPRGRILAVMMDRSSSGRRILVPFVGQGMMMPVGPALLAHRFCSAVFVASSIRAEDGRSKVSFRRLDASAAEDGEALARRIAAALEVEVLKAPDQWYWIYRRQTDFDASQSA